MYLNKILPHRSIATGALSLDSTKLAFTGTSPLTFNHREGSSSKVFFSMPLDSISSDNFAVSFDIAVRSQTSDEIIYPQLFVHTMASSVGPGEFSAFDSDIVPISWDVATDNYASVKGSVLIPNLRPTGGLIQWAVFYIDTGLLAVNLGNNYYITGQVSLYSKEYNFFQPTK